MKSTELRRLTLAIWMIAACAMYAVYWERAIAGWSLGADEYMRLVQVRNLLEGASWSDTVEPRLDPPHGMRMHWTRLPDVPLALAALAFSPWLGIRDGLVLAATVVPPLYLLLLLMPLVGATRLMLGRGAAPVALLVATAAFPVISQFIPGSVDHHGLQLVLINAASACLLIGLGAPRWRRAIHAAGFILALSAWVGIETLPLIAAWFAALGLAWVLRGGTFARDGALAAAAATGLGGVLLLTSVPSSLWLTPVCYGFSILPLAMLVLIGAGFAALDGISRRARTPVLRLAAALVVACAAVTTFVACFPECSRGPYADMDPVVKAHWLAFVGEAQSLRLVWTHAPLSALTRLWPPLLGLAAAAWLASRHRGAARTRWCAVFVLLLASTLMMFVQIRAVPFAHAASLLPVSAIVFALWRRCAPQNSGMLRRSTLVPIVIFFSTFFWIVPASILGATAPARNGAPTAEAVRRCASHADIEPLAEAPPSVILNSMDLGPMLLFTTKHGVIGSPFGEGLKTALVLLRSADDAWIRQQLDARGVQWVVTCPGNKERKMFVTSGGDGLAERLATGRVPDYLVPVNAPRHPNLRVYRVNLRP